MLHPLQFPDDGVLGRSLVVIERLRLRRLCWGDESNISVLLDQFNHFDIVLGSDVVYMEECIPLLFATIARVLKRSSQVDCARCE
jgi:hypothetical protein